MTPKEELKIKLDRLNRKICCVNNDLNNLLSEDVLDALNNATNPSLTNVFLTEENLTNYLPQDVIDALTGANIPSGLNTFVTQTDLGNLPDPITVVANYAALPLPATVTGKFYWAEAAQGTQWLPGNLGGTYYPLGIYYSNGVTWSHIQTSYQATQAEVNTGTNTTKFVTPETLKLSTQWDGTVLLAGRAGGQIINGGTAASENLTLSSTGNATKGAIIFGDSRYNEATNRLILGTATGTGRINLPDAGTTSADGITFGTGTANLYRVSSAQLRTDGSFIVNGQFSVNNGQMAILANGASFVPNTLTGSSATSALSITQTWNTTGNPTAILLNVANTASGTGANLMDLQVTGSSRVRVDKSGIIYFGSNASSPQIMPTTSGGSVDTNGLYLRFNSPGSINNPSIGMFHFTGDTLSATSGFYNVMSVERPFTPTSGSAQYRGIIITPTINQTGGASGVTRGLLINPTLTAAADWRAIESTGRVIFTGQELTGSAATSLLSLTQTWNTTGAPTAILLNVANTNSGASSNLIDLQVGGVSRFKVDKDGNIVIDTTTGTKIGTSTSQKIGLWNATPIVQPTTSVAAAAFVSNSGPSIHQTSTFDGYTIEQVVKALRNIGILA
jgi:hypothetical protein